MAESQGVFPTPFVVKKFGGSSISTPQHMNRVLYLASHGKGPKLVVLSAIYGVTDILQQRVNNQRTVGDTIQVLNDIYIPYIHKLLLDDSLRSKALHKLEDSIQVIKSTFSSNYSGDVLAQGERLSTYLFYLSAKAQGVSCARINAFELIVRSSNGRISLQKIGNNWAERVDREADIYITQGFVCTEHTGRRGNLQRGGSDYSASLLGSALEAEKIEIWSDIDGLHNGDPRYVDNTSPIRRLSYEEAAEMAYFGAKVLHPSTLLPARKKNIPVYLKNTFQPQLHGTCIQSCQTNRGVRAVAAKDNISVIRIHSGRMLMAYGFLSKIFKVFAQYKTPVDMITTSEVSVAMTIDDTTNAEKILESLKKYGQVQLSRNHCIVSVIGKLQTTDSGYARHIFQALKDIPVEMISYGASENNVSILVNSQDKAKTLKLLHQEFFAQKNQQIDMKHPCQTLFHTQEHD